MQHAAELVEQAGSYRKGLVGEGATRLDTLAAPLRLPHARAAAAAAAAAAWTAEPCARLAIDVCKRP